MYLGLAYMEGEGVPQDFQESAQWFRKAADQGEDQRQVRLGFMYRWGRGVPQDFVLAHMWYNLAGSQGSVAGTDLRDEVAREMTSDQIAEAHKLAREWTERSGKRREK